MKRSTLLCMLILILAGCGTFEAGVLGTPTPTVADGEPQPTPTATQPAPTATITPTPTIVMDESPPPGLLYRTDDGLWHVEDDGEPTQLSDEARAQLSPDRMNLLYPSGDEPKTQNLWIADRRTGERRPLIADEEDRSNSCATCWPAHPNTVIASSWPTGIRRGMGGDVLVGFLTAVDSDTGEYRILDNEHETMGTAAPSPDGRTIAYGAGRVGWLYDWNEEWIEVFDPADCDLPDDFTVQSVIRSAWSPDGNKLAWYVQGTLNEENVIAVGVFDQETEEAELLHPYPPIGTDCWPPAPRFDPDGRCVAFQTWDRDRDRSGIWVARTDGAGEEMLVQGMAYDLSAPVWHPRSDYLVASRLGDDQTMAATWMLETDGWTRQELEMPADDAVVVDWWIPGTQ